MDTTTMIILGLVVLALIALLVWASARNKARQAEKRDELRDRFGPEYDRAVQEHGSEKEAADHAKPLYRLDRVGGAGGLEFAATTARRGDPALVGTDLGQEGAFHVERNSFEAPPRFTWNAPSPVPLPGSPSRPLCRSSRSGR